MSTNLQQCLPPNAPAAFNSNSSKGVDSGKDSVMSTYEFGLSGATNKSNAVTAPVRSAKSRFFDKPENHGAPISRSTGMKVTPAKSPR